jgi:hypothetical protein
MTYEQAIYRLYRYGPTFGAHDLHISNYAGLNANSTDAKKLVSTTEFHLDIPLVKAEHPTSLQGQTTLWHQKLMYYI